VGQEFQMLAPLLAGTAPVSEIALLHDYDSRWAIDFQQHTEKYDQIGLLRSYYHALRARSQAMDVINPDVPLDGYKLVVAPDLNLIPEARAKHLLEWVQGGGHLVLGPRSGMKDEFNSLLQQRQPGYLVEPLGGRVEQYYALEKDFPVSGKWGDGTTTVWAEQLKATAADAEVLMKYGASNGWLDGQPAAITRAVGKGRITYIGAVLDEKLMAAAADWMIATSGVTPTFGPVPDGVDVSRREGAGKQVFVLVNFKRETQRVMLPHAMEVALGAAAVDNAVDLPAYGVEVLVDRK